MLLIGDGVSNTAVLRAQGIPNDSELILDKTNCRRIVCECKWSCAEICIRAAIFKVMGRIVLLFTFGGDSGRHSGGRRLGVEIGLNVPNFV